MKYLLILATLIACGLTVFYFNKCDSQKIVYIDYNKVFDNFEMKQELEKKYNGICNDNKRYLDSLSFDLSADSANSVTDLRDNIESKIRNYYHIKNKLKQQEENILEKYNTQTLNQMKSYIETYAEINSINIVLGYSDQSYVLFGDKSYDVTDDIIKYINSVYRGEI